jgi:hypothetical protein
MSREAFQTWMAEEAMHGNEFTIIVDLLGRRIQNAQSIQSGTMVFIRTKDGRSRIVVE